MSEGSTAFRIQVLLSVMRALWDLVTPDLRGVAVRIHYPSIRARFIYEHVGQEQWLLSQESEVYVLGDFPPPVEVEFVADAVPPPEGRDLLPGEEWVYLRLEERFT